MADGKPDFQAQLRALQEAFAQELPKRLADLEKAWTTGEGIEARLEALRRQAHSLAGSGGTFGFPELSTAARALERKVQAIQQEGGRVDADCEADLQSEIAALRAGALPKPVVEPAQAPLLPARTTSGGPETPRWR